LVGVAFDGSSDSSVSSAGRADGGLDGDADGGADAESRFDASRTARSIAFMTSSHRWSNTTEFCTQTNPSSRHLGR
jgi:hypothetical protein